MDEGFVIEVLKQQCKKHKIRGTDRQELLAWARRLMLDVALLENLITGHVDIVCWQGEPVYRITEAGQAYVENELLPPEIRAQLVD